MADMADYYLDLAFNVYEDEREDDDGPARFWKACRCCGAGLLHWENLDGKWRLFDESRRLHECSKVPLPASKAT